MIGGIKKGKPRTHPRSSDQIRPSWLNYRRRGFPLVAAGMSVLVVAISMAMLVSVFYSFMGVLVAVMIMGRSLMLMFMFVFVLAMATHLISPPFQCIIKKYIALFTKSRMVALKGKAALPRHLDGRRVRPVNKSELDFLSWLD